MIVSLTLASLLLHPVNEDLTLRQDRERPRDIWVIRSVLDQHARMVTVALHEDLYIAYDATTSSLYRAWTGGVKWDGSVYTTAHGPQPTTEGGSPYISHTPGASMWTLTSDGRTDSITPVFKGYRMVDGQVRFHYRFLLPGQRWATVYETPEAVSMTASTVGLERMFQTEGLPAGSSIGVRFRHHEQLSGLAFRTDGTVDQANTKREDGWTTTTVNLNSNDRTFITTRFTKEVPLLASLRPSIPVAPRPTTAQSQSQEREPGLSLRVYHIGEPIDKLPELVPGQTPNYSVLIPTVNLDEKGFGSDTTRFVALVDGYINVATAGTYEFRLTSDDGSRLKIGGQTVAETDRIRGMGDAPAVGSAALPAGETPLEIQLFQNEGGLGLKLEWRKQGETAWTVVPNSALTTVKGLVRVTAPGRKFVFGQLRTKPGDKRPLESVHPSYDLKNVVPDTLKPRVGGIDFLPNRDMLICTWDPDGAVYKISNYNGATRDIKVERIASGLAEPLGLKVVNGEIYVLQKQELTRLIDHDKDGIIDEYESVANGWGVTANFHEFAFGLSYENGKFYAALATAINPGGASTQPQNIDRGRVIEIDPKTGSYRFIAAGLRTPNGIGFGAFGKLYISDNQGDWLPSSKIVLVEEGAFYGNRSVDPVGMKDIPETPPVVWLPQNEIGNSPSQIAPLNHGPYRGQMVHGDVTHGGLKRVFVEEVNGRLQGCVFRMTQGLEAGINRVMVGPDGAFYVGGIGSTGDWGQAGKAWTGLQRLTYNRKATFEMLAVRAKSNGMEIELTEPLANGIGETPEFYEMSMWRYVPTEVYGGPKIGEVDLAVKSVTVSNDRKRVFLEADGIRAGHVVYVRMHPSLTSRSGNAVWATEGWYTMNNVPTVAGTVAPTTTDYAAPVLDSERRDGFVWLFDGKNLDKWRGYRQETVPAGWTVQDGAITFASGRGGGDLITREQFGDFDFRFQWRASVNTNSGVIYKHTEAQEASYMTGPEYQILDNKAPGGDNPFTSAGSIYGLYAPKFDVTRPVGSWNEGRIVVQDGKIQHYLNGHLIAEGDLNSHEYRSLLRNSKFNEWPGFAESALGHIAFQDHGTGVAFRNVRIKKLD